MSEATRILTVRAYDADGYVADDASFSFRANGKDRGGLDNSEGGLARLHIDPGWNDVEITATYPGQPPRVVKPATDATECRIVFPGLHLMQGNPFMERHFPAIIGIAFVLLAIVLAFVFSNPTPLQIHIILAVLSLGGGGFAAEIPGMLKVDLSVTSKFTIAATGALALFVILYFAVPAGTPGTK